MEMTIIGIDPHKRSNTAVVLDGAERIASELRVTAGAGRSSSCWPGLCPAPRCGRWRTPTGSVCSTSRQLSSRGEQVADVPASLAAQGRKLSGHYVHLAASLSPDGQASHSGQS